MLENVEEMGLSEDPEFSREQLIMIGFDLFGAGAETSSTTLCWAVQYLTLYPAVQERCSQEVRGLAGSGSITLDHITKLHFCQATIAEIQRCSRVAPTNIMHRLTRNTRLPTGHSLPRDCIVQTNITSFLSSPELWHKPDLFQPERFLDSSGAFFRPEHFVPLGHGRRQCLGEPLARAELGIFFCSLVQRLQFSPAATPPDPTQYTAGLTRAPLPFLVSCRIRN